MHVGGKIIECLAWFEIAKDASSNPPLAGRFVDRLGYGPVFLAAGTLPLIACLSLICGIGVVKMLNFPPKPAPHSLTKE